MNSNQIYLIFQEWLDFYVDANNIEQSIVSNYNQGGVELDDEIKRDLLEMEQMEQNEDDVVETVEDRNLTEGITQDNPLESAIQHPS